MTAASLKNVFFDLDGTLMDTWPGIEATLRRSLADLDLPHDPDLLTRELVGIPLVRVFARLLGGDSPDLERAVTRYRELFPVSGMGMARPFPGVARMLDRLARAATLYLVTARNETIAGRMLKGHGLDRCFAWVRGEREGEAPGGKDHMVAEVLERFGLEPARSVMVGDRRYDVEAALANGVRPVGVAWGYGTREELLGAGASLLATSVEELEGMLTGGL